MSRSTRPSPRTIVSGPLFAGIPERPSSNSLLILGNGFAQAPIHNVVGTWTHTFSPNILNEARFGASWITIFNGTSLRSQHRQSRDSNLGLRTPTPPALACCCWASAAVCRRRPATADLTNVGNQIVNQNFADTVIQFDDGVTITHGKHVFKAGFQMWRYRVNTVYTGNSGQYGDILFGASAVSRFRRRSGSRFLPRLSGSQRYRREHQFYLASVRLDVCRIRSGRLAHHSDTDPQSRTAL